MEIHGEFEFECRTERLGRTHFGDSPNLFALPALGSTTALTSAENSGRPTDQATMPRAIVRLVLRYEGREGGRGGADSRCAKEEGRHILEEARNPRGNWSWALLSASVLRPTEIFNSP